jgi:hypothetical protein
MRLSNLLVIELLLAACEPSKQEAQQLFDSKPFFAEQIALLNKQKTTLQKHVWYNNLSDSLVIRMRLLTKILSKSMTMLQLR